MTEPLVVKIGGGLLAAEERAGLEAACADVRALAASGRRVLVVPGGGPFADAVRAVDARIGLGDALAHQLALAAMDQVGAVIRTLIGANDDVEVLDVVAAFGDRPESEVPRTWAVTSDSLAVLAAGMIGADTAVLLKPVAGVLARWPSDEPPLPTLTADALAALQSDGGGRAVDAYLPEAVRRTGVTVVVRRPGTPDAAGTRITSA